MPRRHVATIHTAKPKGPGTGPRRPPTGGRRASPAWRDNLPAHTASTLKPSFAGESFVTDTKGIAHYYRQPGQTVPRHARKPRKRTR